MTLAEVALESERGRIDIELRESVVSELEEVIMKGVHAEDAAGRGSPQVEEELESLVREMCIRDRTSRGAPAPPPPHTRGHGCRHRRRHTAHRGRVVLRL